MAILINEMLGYFHGIFGGDMGNVRTMETVHTQEPVETEFISLAIFHTAVRWSDILDRKSRLAIQEKISITPL